MQKGQNVRLFLSSNNTDAPTTVIAAARTLQLHVSCTVEECSTKDTNSDWIMNEVTDVSFDITTSALVRGDDSISSTVSAKDLASLESLYEAGEPVKFKIANTSGANNRTSGASIMSGSVIISQLTMNGPNRQVATYDAQMQGVGLWT